MGPIRVSNFKLKECFSGELFWGIGSQMAILQFPDDRICNRVDYTILLKTLPFIGFWVTTLSWFPSYFCGCSSFSSFSWFFFTRWLTVDLSFFALCFKLLFFLFILNFLLGWSHLLTWLKLLLTHWCFLNLHLQLRTLFWSLVWHVQLLTSLPF